MVLKIVIGLYGGLSLIAAILQGKYKNIPGWSAVILGLGGIFMLGTLCLDGYLSVGILVVGVILAHISAIINGVKMYGEINKSHHFARFIVSILLVAAQVMSVK